MEERKIKQLLVSVEGSGTHIVNATEETPIEMFLENGEMAPVKWYRHGADEYNGKYVISIVYTDL